MTDLRKIAQHAKKCVDPLHRDITTTLLNALVEEREHVRRLLCPLPVMKCNKKHKQEALRELNLDLEGVWPGENKA